MNDSGKNDLKIKIKLNETPAAAVCAHGGDKALEIFADDGVCSAAVYYDYSQTPLTLKAAAAAGDEIEIILMPHRIEMYVNGALCDEEWPCGERLFVPGDGFARDGKIDIECGAHTPEAKAEPEISGRFQNAEGWRPEENVFVGDCMPYVSNGRYHVLYLKDRHHHTSKWSLGAHQWEHISTDNFTDWALHPTAVEITEPYEGSICTGSWIKGDKNEQLYYTVRMADRSAAPICRSVSPDGYHFKKDGAFKFILPEKYDLPSARDPKVIKAEDGVYHMFVTTSLKAEQKGCLAHLVSDDLESFSDCGEPIYISKDATQPECPDYIRYGGRYYLIFSLDGAAHYLMSDKPFSDWKKPENDVIPCSCVPKGAVWNDKIVFTGYYSAEHRYAGVMTFNSARAGENGELIFDFCK